MGLPGDYKYTDEQLKEAISQSKSYAEALRVLGAGKYSHGLVARMKDLDVSKKHFIGSRRASYTKERLEAVVSECESYADVARALGVKPIGGNIHAIGKALKREEIDISHFTGQAHQKGKGVKKRKRPEEILILRPREQVREKGARLTWALLEIGYKYECALCGLQDEWNGKSLTLRTDHINGKYWDCRKNNLRFVCPNCDSQLETYCAKNRGR